MGQLRCRCFNIVNVLLKSVGYLGRVLLTLTIGTDTIVVPSGATLADMTRGLVTRRSIV